jgi:phosphinothricin acetyltransferase
VTSSLLIRPSTTCDLPGVTALYAWNVRHETGTFEIDPPDEAEMAKRHRESAARGLPWLVAQRDDQLLGYACAHRFRPREAFRFCVEDSIYIAAGCRGLGIGRLLLAELISQCEARGATQMLAVIGDAANAGSIGLHRALGFAPAGVLKAVGWKFNRWLDVVLMQRRLGPGTPQPQESTNDRA